MIFEVVPFFKSFESIHMNYPQFYPQGVDNLYVYPQTGVDKVFIDP